MPLSVEVVDEADSGLETSFFQDAVRKVVANVPISRPTSVTIRLVRDGLMRRLNRRFLGVKAPTDVLSFPLHEFREGQPPANLPDGPILLGEIVVNLDQAKRQGAQAGQATRREVQSLIEHGARHLIGFHHD